MDVLVIGAGPSGLMAAIMAAREGARVVILEKMEKPGKKLLTTGNGRCNLSNHSILDGRNYHTENPEEADQILRRFAFSETEKFFSELGLLLKSREGGWIYPYSDQAQSVLDALLWEVERLKIKLKCREEVREIFRDEKGFLVKTEGWQYAADRVVLSLGGKAAPVTGSCGNGYTLAKNFGHTVIPVLPALVPLTIDEREFKALEGVRSRVSLTLLVNGEPLAKESGELQWTAYGISGIVVFQLSSLAVRYQNQGAKVQILADLFPDQDEAVLCQKLNDFFERGIFSYEKLLSGFFHKKVLSVLLKRKQIKPQEKAERKRAEEFLKSSKVLCLTISGARSFEQAQVCSGGVSLKEIYTETMESKLVPGLYLTGELLDVDGPCGGFNLQWAWASGWLAGKYAGKGKR